MSKKKKLKTHILYTNIQFVEIVCKQCKHCHKQGVKNKAEFCYSIYRGSPKKFIEGVIPRLKKIHKCILTFEDIFCEKCDVRKEPVAMTFSGIPKKCANFNICLDSFKKQTGELAIKGRDLKITSFAKIKNYLNTKQRKKKEPYRVAAYPTLFHGNADPDWKLFIKEVIEDNDDTLNISEQDNNTKPS